MVDRRTLLKAGGLVGVPAALGWGAKVYPFRPHLYEVRIANRRDEPVNVDVRLDADGETVLESTVDFSDEPPGVHLLPCEWPRAAWSYEMAVRPTDRDEWQTITWNDPRRLCKKIYINEVDESVAPVWFYESSNCPSEHSCGSQRRRR